MIRPSALPIAEHCGLAPELAKQHERGDRRDALIGTAYHALVAKDPKAMDHVDALTVDERRQLMARAVPTDLPPVRSHEIKIGLTPQGRWAEYGARGNLTEGTADIAWLEAPGAVVRGDVEEPPAVSTLVLADVKAGPWSVEDGPLSLQLAAYAFALADHWRAQAFRPAIWYYGEARWDWGPVVLLDSEEAADLWRRVVIAATKRPEATPGPWCDRCYERAHCPARLLPALAGPLAPELEPFIVDGPPLTPERAADGLRVIAAMREVAERAEEQIRAEVRKGLRLEVGGKVYGPSFVQGRETIDKAALERDGLAEQYTRRGKPYERWGWRRA